MMNDAATEDGPPTLFQQVGTPGRERPSEEKTMKIFGKTALALFISFGITGSALAQSQSGGSMSSGAMSDKPAASGSMSSGSMSGSMTGSMDHKMKGKKKDKAAMTSGSMSGSMSNGSMSSGSMSNSAGH